MFNHCGVRTVALSIVVFLVSLVMSVAPARPFGAPATARAAPSRPWEQQGFTIAVWSQDELFDSGPALQQ